MALRKVSTITTGASSLSDVDVAITEVDWIAPGGGMFELTGMTDAQFRDAGVVWEFTDSDSDSYSLPRQSSVWSTNGTPNRRFAIGPKAARVFETAETVTWTCDVYYQGAHRQFSGSIVISDPEVVYGDTYTFYASPTSDFPVGASNTYTNWDDAINAARLNDGPNGALVLLNRGETFDLSAALKSRLRGGGGVNFDKIVLGAYGTGSKPVITGNMVQLDEIAAWKVLGLRFEGGWDSTTETGTATWAVNCNPAELGSVGMFHGCEFDGFEIAIRPVNTVGVADAVDKFLLLLVSEVHVTNWKSYAYFGAAKKLALIGNAFLQHADALGGGKAKDTGHNEHGPVRVPQSPCVLAWACDTFSNMGWNVNSAHGDIVASGGADINGDVPSHQPGFRINTDAVAGRPEISIAGCFMEGGFGALSLNTANGTTESSPHKCAASSNIILGSANTKVMVETSRGGASFYNNVTIMPAVLKEQSGLSKFIQDHPEYESQSADNTDYPVNVYSNAIIFLYALEESASGFVDDLSRYAGSETANNIIHAPNLSTGADTSFAPLDATAVGMSPLYKGFRWEDSPTLDSDYATPSDTVALYQPQTGSAAIGSATGKIAELTFFGVKRVGSDMGPFEYVAA